MGGFHKRLATMTTGAERAQHLLASHPLLRAKHINSSPRRYYELNWIQLVQVAKLDDIEPGESLAIFEAAASAFEKRLRKVGGGQSVGLARDRRRRRTSGRAPAWVTSD